MALIQNDIGPLQASKVLNFMVIAIVVVVGGFFLYKQFRQAIFPAPVDATKCAQDDNYHYKDPSKHPNDC